MTDTARSLAELQALIPSAQTGQVSAQDIRDMLVSTYLYDVVAWETAEGTTPTDYRFPPGNVLRYGADPTGVADSTAAFNLATRSGYVGTSIYDLNFAQEVIVPGGEYKITGAVYVHKGQHLKGAGEGATRINMTTATAYGDHIFQLGRGAADFDAGGLPPQISHMWMFGGPSTKAVVYTGAAGYTIHNLFMTSCGVAIHTIGTGGRISDIYIDQGLNAIKVGGHNNVFENLQIFWMNYGIITVPGEFSACTDNYFSNLQIQYSIYNSVTLSDAVVHNNLSFDNCQFLLNAQAATFDTFVKFNCDDADNIAFNNCTFNNMKSQAIGFSSAGTNNQVVFNDSIFDGNKTLSDYAQSTTGYAAFVTGGECIFNNCTFKNLLDNPIYVNGHATALTRVSVRGGLVENCANSTIIKIAATAPTAGSVLSVTDVKVVDQQKTPFDVVAGGWFYAGDGGQVLTGNGGTTIAQYPTGRDSTYLVDTASATATVRLPRTDDSVYARPKHGDKLTFIDSAQNWNTNNVTFLRGDNTINGASSDYVASTNGGKVTFVFNSETLDWSAESGLSPKGIIPDTQYATNTSAFTLTDVSTAQAAFPAAIDTFTLEANSTYEFQGTYLIVKGTSSASVAIGFPLTTAVVSDIGYITRAWNGTSTALSTTARHKRFNGTSINNIVTNANTSTNQVIEFRGIMRVTTGGTCVPQIKFSAAPGGTNQMLIGSYIKFVRLGSNTAQSAGGFA